MDIDDAAPVISRESIQIHASVDTVWRIHIDVRAWPKWQPDITEASTDAVTLAAGSQFTWSSGGLTVTSTVHDIDAPRKITWGGPAHGIDGRHVWEFSSDDEDTVTTVHTRESWSGAPVDADRDSMQSSLDTSLQNWLRHLKQRCEAV